MTVCIAAMCQGMIFGAADRMRTAGDVQFEPQSGKMFPFTASISVMTAGTTTFQREIIQDLYNVVNLRVKRDPQNWWKVKDVTELYVHFYNQARLKRAEAAILAPLGLTHDTFIARQAEMSEGFVNSITKEMLNFQVPDVAAIITGIDEDGPHIYVAENNNFSCWDTIGFAAIGSGARHAETQFMSARHHPNASVPETLLLTYYAKKRAETAPGVGKDTDMFLIGPNLGVNTAVDESVKVELEKVCKDIIKKEEKMHKDAREKVKRYVEQIQENATEKEQGESGTVDGQVPADESGISDVNSTTGKKSKAPEEEIA